MNEFQINLLNFLDQDNEVRSNSELWLQEYVEQNPDSFFEEAKTLIEDPNSDNSIIYLILVLICHNVEKLDQMSLVSICFDLFLSQYPQIRQISASIISSCLKDYVSQSSSLENIQFLIDPVQNKTGNIFQIDSCFISLSQIIEQLPDTNELKNEIIKLFYNSLFEFSDESLLNDLLRIINDFIPNLFSLFDSDQINSFLQLLLANIQNESYKLTIYKLFNTILQLDYSFICLVSKELIQISINDFQSCSDDSAVLQLLWFWINVAHIEYENLEISRLICHEAAPQIVPYLFILMDLSLSDEIIEETEWEIPVAARSCLSGFAKISSQITTPLIMEALPQKSGDTPLYMASIFLMTGSTKSLEEYQNIIFDLINAGFQSESKRVRYASLYCLEKLAMSEIQTDFYPMILIIVSFFKEEFVFARLTSSVLMKVIKRLDLEVQVQVLNILISSYDDIPINHFYFVLKSFYSNFLKNRTEQNTEMINILFPSFLVCLQAALQSQTDFLLGILTSSISSMLSMQLNDIETFSEQLTAIILSSLNQTNYELLLIIPNLFLKSEAPKKYAVNFYALLFNLLPLMKEIDPLYMLMISYVSIILTCPIQECINQAIDGIYSILLVTDSLKIASSIYEIFDSCIHLVEISPSYYIKFCTLTDSMCENLLEYYESSQKNEFMHWTYDAINLIMRIDGKVDLSNSFQTLCNLFSSIALLPCLSDSLCKNTIELMFYLCTKYGNNVIQLFQNHKSYIFSLLSLKTKEIDDKKNIILQYLQYVSEIKCEE